MTTAPDITAPDPAAPDPAAPAGIDGRTWHYRDFYGVASEAPAPDERPLLLVHGNCQAEALRVVLADTEAFRCVRMPAVHELTAADVPHLQRLLGRCDVLVVQPIRDDYHGLAVGTAQVRSTATRARVVMFPVIRDSALYPFQALVRVDEAGDPPVVPYHDLRTLAEAADVAGVRPAASLAAKGSDARRAAAAPVMAQAFRDVADASRDELRRREATNGTLVVSDLLDDAGPDASHTLNHPGNPVFVALAQRVCDALGVTGVVAADPGRTLLRSVIAPLDPAVLEALGLDIGRARRDWLVAGEVVEDALVRDEQRRWYGGHPDVVLAGVERHGRTMAVLGL